MPVEPPVVSPHDLPEAYAVLADGPARPSAGVPAGYAVRAAGPARPIAGGTDLMVALTGELGEPPERILDLWGLDALRGIALAGDALSPGAPAAHTDIPRPAGHPAPLR